MRRLEPTRVDKAQRRRQQLAARPAALNRHIGDEPAQMRKVSAHIFPVNHDRADNLTARLRSKPSF